MSALLYRMFMRSAGFAQKTFSGQALYMAVNAAFTKLLLNLQAVAEGGGAYVGVKARSNTCNCFLLYYFKLGGKYYIIKKG